MHTDVLMLAALALIQGWILGQMRIWMEGDK